MIFITNSSMDRLISLRRRWLWYYLLEFARLFWRFGSAREGKAAKAKILRYPSTTYRAGRKAGRVGSWE